MALKFTIVSNMNMFYICYAQFTFLAHLPDGSTHIPGGQPGPSKLLRSKLKKIFGPYTPHRPGPGRFFDPGQTTFGPKSATWADTWVRKNIILADFSDEKKNFCTSQK